MRAGISRVAVEVILLVLAVALALLIFSPVGSFIFSALGRTQLAGGATTLELISVNVFSNNTLKVVIKNQGPGSLTDCYDPGNWTVVVKPSGGGEYPFTPDSVSGDSGNDEDLSVSESWTLTVDDVSSSGVTPTDTFTVIVFGPEGTRAEYIYRP